MPPLALALDVSVWCLSFVLTEGHVAHFCAHFCLYTALFMRQNLVVRKTCRTFALQRAEMPFCGCSMV